MAETQKPKPELHLAGPKEGLVTIDDLAKLYRQLTGREPTEEDLKEAEKILRG